MAVAASSRGLSNNGTASGGGGLKTAGLPPLAVRMQSPGGNDREGREAGPGTHAELASLTFPSVTPSSLSVYPPLS